MIRKHICLPEDTWSWMEQYAIKEETRNHKGQLSASQVIRDVLERFTKREVVLTREDLKQIEDRVINPITGIILKLEKLSDQKNDQQEISSCIELIGRVMHVLSDYGLIGKRKPYKRSGE